MKEKTNLIFIVVDALRAKSLGCYGYPLATSPNIDGLAKKGVLFKDAYTCATTTDPAFTSLCSGLYPPSHGIVHHANRVTKEETEQVLRVPLLAEILKSEGFQTFGFDFLSRWHRRGFDYYTGLKGAPKSKLLCLMNKVRNVLNIHPGTPLQKLLEKTLFYDLTLKLLFARSTPYLPADKLTDEAIKVIEEQPQSRLFLFLHYWDCHHPYSPPEEHPARLREADYTDLYPNLDRGIKEVLSKTCPPLTNFFIRETAKGRRDLASIIRSYDTGVGRIDSQIARLYRALDEKGLLENSLIILTADHGESLTEHEVYFTHDGLYNEILHIPLIMLHPTLPAKQVSGLVQSVDLMPTILDFLDIDYSQLHFDGCNLLPMVLQEKKARSEGFAWHYSPISRERAIFSEDFKYISSEPGGGQICEYCHRMHRAEEELYNLKDDAKELKNLIGEDKATGALLKRKLNDFVKGLQTRGRGGSEARPWSEKEEKEVIRRLEDLGYF
jgi:arylsulfatase A-like enzyme